MVGCVSMPHSHTHALARAWMTRVGLANSAITYANAGTGCYLAGTPPAAVSMHAQQETGIRILQTGEDIFCLTSSTC